MSASITGVPVRYSKGDAAATAIGGLADGSADEMQRIQIALVGWGCLVGLVNHSAGLTLGADAPSGNPLIMNAGTNSAPLLVDVTGDVSPASLSDFMTAWQLTLLIAPDPGTNGDLSFNSMSEPSAYVLENINLGIITDLSEADTKLLALDVNSPFSGGREGSTSGDNLMSIDFLAASDAEGLFGIFALGLTSEWSDASQPVLNAREFENAPSAAEPVRIAEVMVIPEPCIFSILLAASLGLLSRRGC